MRIISANAAVVDFLDYGDGPRYDKEEPIIREEIAVSIEWPGRPGESVGPVLLDSQTIRNRICELGIQITQDYRGKTPHLIGILKGASIFHADLIRTIKLELSYDFIAVGSYGKLTKSSGEVRILKDLDESLEGRDVLLVEDIVDTGLTLHYLVQNLNARNPRSLKTAALLNKPARREIDVSVDYIGFDIPDEFVVGYGLDYSQRYRNLPDICILRLKP
jgi:hypoxanthine phosphoribosyltransferase